ncbi:hypothetical protein KIPB_011836, partial [Kipferlia bialata]
KFVSGQASTSARRMFALVCLFALYPIYQSYRAHKASLFAKKTLATKSVPDRRSKFRWFVTIWSWVQLVICMLLCLGVHVLGNNVAVAMYQTYFVLFFTMTAMPVAARLVAIQSKSSLYAAICAVVCLTCWSNDLHALSGGDTDFTDLPQVNATDLTLVSYSLSLSLSTPFIQG